LTFNFFRDTLNPIIENAREGVVSAICVVSQHPDHMVWLTLINETHV